MKRDCLRINEFSKEELLTLIDRALELKTLVKTGECPPLLKGKTLAMIFEKASTRTRVSFDMAMNHFGGHSLILDQQSSQLGRGETVADTARVLSGYVNAIMFRTFSHSSVKELAKNATVPVINGLCDSFHPCQIATDLTTLKEYHADLENMTVSYVGDGNNMTHSWMTAAALLGFTLKIATPEGYGVDAQIKAELSNASIHYFTDPKEAVAGCDAINTDTWFSMGQEVSDEKRTAFTPFQVNNDLLKLAKENALVLHCLPAHRGEEITDDVMDGPQSVVFTQAENRTYAQMAILEKLILTDEQSQESGVLI
jgi:ornithine carbamoyltransferase